MLTSRCVFMLLLFIDCCPCTRSILAVAARPIGLDTNTRPPTSNPHDNTFLTANQYFSCPSSELGFNCRSFSGDNINVHRNQPGTQYLTTEAADVVATSVLKSQDNGEVDHQSKYNSYDILALITRRTPPPGSPPHVHKAPEIKSVNMQKTFHYPQSQDNESEHRVINSPSVIIHYKPFVSGHEDHDAGAVFDSIPTYSVLRNITPPPGRGKRTKL